MTATAHPTATAVGPSRRGAFAHRDYRLFWTGALISNIGTWMQNIAVPFVVYDITGSSAWVGLSAAAMLVPGVVLAPPAGAVADRVDRRRLLFWLTLAQAAAAIALAAVWAAGVHRPGVILALVTVSGILFALSMPPWQGFVSDLVPRADLPSAITYNSLQFHGSRAIGPAIGGIVLATLGPASAFLLNGLSYAAVLVAIGAVHTRSTRRPASAHGLARQLLDGFSYARRHLGIATALLLVAAIGFFGNPIVQLAPVFAEEVFDVGAGAYGFLAGAFGLGAALGIWLLGTLSRTHPRSRLVGGALVVLGLAIVGFGLAPVYPAGLVAVLVAGATAVGTGTQLLTSVQLTVADDLRGRVLGVYAMVFTASYPLGALVQGALADAIGPRQTEVLAGAAVLALATLLAVRPAKLRALDGTVGACPADR